MQCPRCYTQKTDVYDTRVLSSGNTIKRRRECGECGFRFITMEDVFSIPIVVSKRNGQQQPFDREKLSSGVKKSFNKRKVSKSEIDDIVEAVISKMLTLKKDIYSSIQIGEITLEVLKTKDKVAYICFFAMFGNLTKYEDFVKILNEIN